MSARRARQELKAGMQEFETMIETMVEKHLNPADLKPRSSLSIALGCIPHLVILAFAVIVVWTAKPSSSLFSWHPTLMTLTFTVLMTEAIYLFSPWSSPMVHGGDRPTKVQWHWVVQALSVVSMFTGFSIITANKMINDSRHYTSWHGLSGLILCGVVAMQISGGIVEQYPDILPFKVRLVVLKRLHAFFGMVTYFGGLYVLTLGLYSSWFVANVDQLLWKVCFACPVLLGLTVLVQVVRNHFWCRKR